MNETRRGPLRPAAIKFIRYADIVQVQPPGAAELIRRYLFRRNLKALELAIAACSLLLHPWSVASAVQCLWSTF
jgi:hypothetical protein